MLELPELDIIRERLRPALIGRRVSGMLLLQRMVMMSQAVPLESLRSTYVNNIVRLGQHLTFGFSTGLYLDLDFTRGGRLELVQSGPTHSGSGCLVIQFEGHAGICATDQNRPPRLAVYLVQDLDTVPHRTGPGLDPLSPAFTLNRFTALLSRRNRPVRHVLTDKRVLVGIGSAYADEILFEARLSPFQTTLELKPEMVIRFYSALKKVLGAAILHHRSLAQNHLPNESDRLFLKVHRRQGEPCLRCGTPIRLVRDGRLVTSYCPGCQTEGQLLADRGLPAASAGNP
ncbi:MAG: DNA-formamidopyrimidine glycosylase family protein [candidate division WOR-3 bacterium]